MGVQHAAPGLAGVVQQVAHSFIETHEVRPAHEKAIKATGVRQSAFMRFGDVW